MLPHVCCCCYQLPDGNEIQVGVDRFKVPELLFQPVSCWLILQAGSYLFGVLLIFVIWGRRGRGLAHLVQTCCSSWRVGWQFLPVLLSISLVPATLLLHCCWWWLRVHVVSLEGF